MKLRKPLIFLCLSGMLLSSCHSRIREDLYQFIKDFDIKTVQEKYKKATVTYRLQVQEEGVTTLTMNKDFTFDFTVEGDYHASLETNSTGYPENGEVPSHALETIEPIEGRQDAYLYLQVTEGVETVRQELNGQGCFDKIQDFYYTQTSGQNMVSGGMYYGDDIKLHLKYQDLMTVNGDGTMTYEMKNAIDDNRVVSSVYYIVNSDGMVLLSRSNEYNSVKRADIVMEAKYD